MLDVENIKRIHESDNEIVGVPFPDMQLAMLMFEQAHYHRGLLLAEVERQGRKINKLETHIDTLEATGKILVA